MKKHIYLRLISLIAMLSVALTVVGTPAQAATPYKSHPIRVEPIIVKAQASGSQSQFPCQTPGYAYRCYAPKQIRAAYSIQPLLDKGITGKGRKIIIVDAYQSPTVQQDLDFFDNLFGLKSTKINVIAPDGLTPFDSTDLNQVGWAEEISLDVQWAHVVAPDATINLVLAKSNQDADILSVTQYAVEHNLGDVLSQSFGEAESCVDPKLLVAEHEVFEQAAQKHITVLASSGDQGAAQATCDGSSYILSASSPASDPLVTGVGGTQLNADLNTGKYISEVAWNEPAYGVGTGGGYSTIYKRPFYQNGVVKKAWRGVPDVSYNAGIDDGVLVHLGFPGIATGTYDFGGTSAGSPQWAGIVALLDQHANHRLGFINPTLYAIGKSWAKYPAAFHDIEKGNNTFAFTDANNTTVTIPGYTAGDGWDATTGWGSPIVSHLIWYLW